MNNTPQCILKIKQAYPGLIGKYRVIADFFLANPDRIITEKGKAIAQACQCDDSQIIRFCQKIGYRGLSGMRASIASELIPISMGKPGTGSGTRSSFEERKAEFSENYLRTVNDTMGLIDRRDIEKSVTALSKAKKIHILGSGSSGLAAMDLQIKLQRMGRQAVYNRDPGLNRMLCGLVDPKDVVIAFSFSGEAQEVCELASICKDKGAMILGITNFSRSRLGSLSDLVLLTASTESSFRLGAMTSRVAQSLIIDFLIINLAIKNMDRTEKSILRTHNMIEGKR